MNEHEQRSARTGQRAARIYTLLLWLYPRAHQQAFGKQMRQTFQDHYRDAVEADGQGAIAFWLEVAADEGKSVLRERIAALAERNVTVKKLLSAAWEPLTIVVALALLTVLAGAVHLNNIAPLLLAIPIYLALLFLVVRLMWSVSQAGGIAGTVSWWRLGLMLGGIIGLYMVALNLLDALAPIPGPQNRYGDNVGPVWALALPLLAGVVGVVAGYVSGRTSRGIGAGLLAGGVMLLMQVVSTVLLVVVLWNALQANALHSQLQAGAQDWIQHQWGVQHPGAAPSLWTYLTNYNNDASIAFGIVFKSLYTVIAWAPLSIVGSAIGARTAHQTRATQRLARVAWQATRTPSRGHPMTFTILLLVLGVLMWSAFTVVAGRLTHASIAFLSAYLSASFVTPAFLAWLLVFVAMVAAVYLTAGPKPTRQGARRPA